MSQRIAALLALAGFVLAVMGVWLWGGNVGPQAPSSRVSFQIATGSTGSLYFPVGQALAGVISHPPGVGRCETATVCGPAGVILSTRTSEGAADNLRSIDQGLVDSGLSEGDVIAAAVKGRSPLLGACADVGHWVRSGLDPIACLKKLEGRVITLHFKDLNEPGPKAHDVPWGTGISNAKGMLAELQRQKFRGAICVEYEYHWENSAPEIAQSAAWFNATCAELVSSGK